jgi:hypothetical protein
MSFNFLQEITFRNLIYFFHNHRKKSFVLWNVYQESGPFKNLEIAQHMHVNDVTLYIGKKLKCYKLNRNKKVRKLRNQPTRTV